MAILVDPIAVVMPEMLIAPRREMLAAMREGRAEDAECAIRLHFEETGSLLLDYASSAMAG